MLMLLAALAAALPALAQEPRKADSLEGAISRCIGKEGANGAAVGDIAIDLKTGKVVYRCDSDPKTEERQLAPGSLPGVAAQPPAPQPAPAPGLPGAASAKAGGTTGSTPDYGAKAAYVNRPVGDPPRRPQDCVGAHPYWLTFPTCVIAAKMGLLGPRQEKAGATATTAAPAPLPPGDAALATAAGDAAGVSETTGAAEGGAMDEAGGLDAVVQAPVTPADKAAAEAATARSIGTGAGSAAMEDPDAGLKTPPPENALGPVGSVARMPVREESSSWLSMVLWGLAGLGGLIGSVILVLGIIVLINRMRMRRAGDEDDPYAAYFDSTDNLDEEEGVDMDAASFMQMDNDAPLASFEEDDNNDTSTGRSASGSPSQAFTA